ncbi:MAG: GNAT family N-acetyltransferase [Chloroflexi bacterium]|nr:GNAT family N-acetyltransferase [Chloroflexota bacterium]MDA1239569.1 GNAT family N-acetyltransferase [Chloroflexota bacterium]
MPHDSAAEGRLTVTEITTPEALAEALSVRMRVFVEEQGVPANEEVDRYDSVEPGTPAVHVLARLDGVAVATARLLLDVHAGEHPHIGRVAVLAEHRGRHFGVAVMEALHAEARRRGSRGVTLAAQLHAIPFYERQGYVARGPVFLDAGIEHRDMDLDLPGD